MKLSFYMWIVFLLACCVALSEAIVMIIHGVQVMRRTGELPR